MLLGGGELDGTRVFDCRQRPAMTTAQRVGMFDETFKHVIDWGLGLIVDSKKYGADTVPYGFGPYSSPRTFGHGGIQSSVGMADPDRELVVAVVQRHAGRSQARHPPAPLPGRRVRRPRPDGMRA